MNEMEDWEKELRDKLEKELEDAAYEIGVGNFVAWTGKGGKIEYEVALQKQIRRITTEVLFEKTDFSELIGCIRNKTKKD